ncbi:hypothetical protein B0H63DRAFT_95490 [Podospora didyma]|uniref:MARVEL domain-containing protein n=1 Tax=Podospora didyma TaxID=330526 RepID=A0AAE0NWS6_9PEZI|nr:hypothetical protein B0H63DRAFT_95490 [Podospora didyma]
MATTDAPVSPESVPATVESEAQQLKHDPTPPAAPPKPNPNPPLPTRREHQAVQQPYYDVVSEKPPVGVVGPEGPPPPVISRECQMIKLGLATVSLMASTVLFAVGLALGLKTAPYRDNPFVVPEIILALCAAGIAILGITLDFLIQWLTKERRPIAPGYHVAIHLLVWLVALVAAAVTGVGQSPDAATYRYYSGRYITDLSRDMNLEQILLGFDCLLLFIHLILFCRACVETSRENATKPKMIYVRVAAPVGGPYAWDDQQNAALQQAALQHGMRYPNEEFHAFYAPVAPVAPNRNSSLSNQRVPYEYYAPIRPAHKQSNDYPLWDNRGTNLVPSQNRRSKRDSHSERQAQSQRQSQAMPQPQESAPVAPMPTTSSPAAAVPAGSA